MDVADLRALALEFCDVAKNLSETEVVACHRLSKAVQDHMEHKWDATIVANVDEVIVAIYMSDGWGADISSRAVSHIGSSVVVRSGRLRHDFLLHRGLLRVARRDGSTIIQQRISEPIGLGRGRKAWNVFSAACDFASMPRSLGARNICVSLCLFDGCLFHCAAPTLGSPTPAPLRRRCRDEPRADARVALLDGLVLRSQMLVP